MRPKVMLKELLLLMKGGSSEVETVETWGGPSFTTLV